MWKVIKQETNQDQTSLPRRINVDGISYTSSKKIADKYNDFIKEKIEKLRATFKDSKVDPIEILEYIIPRPNTTFKLPEITIPETEKLIKDMKCNNTVGHDGISSRMLKAIPDLTAIHLTHAINISIRESIFPEILKVSRILPISKKGKCKTDLNSFRPVSNLHTMEKIYEKWIKIHLCQYIEVNEIMTASHHGGIAKHSTMTAKTLIDYRHSILLITPSS